MAVLGSLNLYERVKEMIPFGASLMFELHHTELNGWFVRIFYKNSLDVNAAVKKLKIPGEWCPE